MSRNQNPSFFSGTPSDGEFLAQFRSPLPRTSDVFSLGKFDPLFWTVLSSFIVLSILYVSFLLQGILSSALLLLAAFLLAMSVYSINRVTDLEEDSVNMPDNGRFVKKNRDYWLFAAFESIIIAVILAFFTNPAAIIVILFAFCVGVFYGRGSRRFRLKNVLFLKNIIVAGTMATAAVLLPLAVHANIVFIVLLVAYFIFLKILIEAVLHDVRDVEGDRKAGVRSVPASLGMKKTRNLLLLLNSTLVVWLAFSLFQAIFYPYIFVLILSVLYGYWIILRITRPDAKRSRVWYSLVAGEWMILGLYATPFALGWLHIL
jgi:4-hydroxybenzoate polyprenyltransferase